MRLTGNWLLGGTGLLGGAIAVALAPKLSNEHSYDSSGNDQGSSRDAAYGLGGLAIVTGGIAAVIAISQQSGLGVRETYGSPVAEVTDVRAVSCGGAAARPSLRVHVSGPSESLLVGQTDVRGEIAIRLTLLPSGLREEIATTGHLDISVDTDPPMTAGWEVPSSLCSRMQRAQAARPGGPQQVAESQTRGEEIGDFTVRSCKVQDGQSGIAMGNGNGRIDPGEMVEVVCGIRNVRSDLKGELVLEPATTDRDVVLSSAKPLEINGWWPQGEEKFVTFGLSVKKQNSLPVGQALPVIIRITRPGLRVLAEVPTNLHLGN